MNRAILTGDVAGERGDRAPGLRRRGGSRRREHSRLYDPDVELDATRLGVGDLGIYHGHEGLRSLFGELHEVWGEIEYDYEDLIGAGEHVVAVVTRHARGRASGVDVEAPLALVWTVREGRVVRVVWFLTREEAFKAAGLSE